MIYLIVTEDKKYCKIGYTNNPQLRFQAIQNGNHLDVIMLYRIYGNKIEEARLHILFNKYHLKREWFNYHLEIVNYFKSKFKPIIAEDIIELTGESGSDYIIDFKTLSIYENNYTYVGNIKKDRTSPFIYYKIVDIKESGYPIEKRLRRLFTKNIRWINET